ncbi:MAG: transposase, partial [Psychromonas sp.]
MTARKKYSKEFKLDAISLVNEQGYSKADAAAYSHPSRS